MSPPQATLLFTSGRGGGWDGRADKKEGLQLFRTLPELLVGDRRSGIWNPRAFLRGRSSGIRVSQGDWFTVKKMDYFWLEKGTFYRVCGPEIVPESRYGTFYENLSAGSVANVPFF